MNLNGPLESENRGTGYIMPDKEIVDMTFAIGSWIAFGRLTHVLEFDGVCMPTALVHTN
jgi:hypothetical protein